MSAVVLALNCGSSSLKYALFEQERAVLRGEVERVGTGGPEDHGAAVQQLFDLLSEKALPPPAAVGHRLVHGGPEHFSPELVTESLLASLTAAIPFAPIHLPAGLRAIEAVRTRFGNLPQVACFDTAFHQALPEVAQRFALPEALFRSGVRRYGFHGLSYEYVVQSLGAEHLGRAVIAHLGSGASMVAVRDGCSLDTTMAFTPTAGLLMGTRSGDLDPGLLVYLLQHRGYDAQALDQLVNHQAGLLALSGISADMRVLLSQRATSPRAALAIEMFCYQARKAIGALAAVLGGLDNLVFTGGIGENAPEIRSEICAGLGYLPCQLRVVKTDEESMIAHHTRKRLSLD